jgi:hypothetical protein
MFRKIISNLPFSTALVEQLSDYAKKLKKEESIRKISLFFIVLSVIVQLFMLIRPPESANAGDIIYNLEESSKTLENKGLKLSTSAVNINQGFIDASIVISKPHEQISYTVVIDNPTDNAISARFENNLSDILEYAEIIDGGGGKLNKSNSLMWPETVIEPKSQQSRTFVVRLLKDIPATANGTNNFRSYDCKLTNIFGNTVNINIECPAPKIAEQIILKLPKIDATISTAIMALMLLVGVYFYTRAKQIREEVRIIRKDVNSGAI